MKVIVDLNRCEANGVCVRCCPEVFELDDDELIILMDTIPEDLKKPVERAVEGCPRQALSLQE